MQLPELLAPAGSFDAAIAAFTYGADAIYLGLSRFSARADAANFSDEELTQIIAYARNLERPRKVYVTLNTLIEAHEMEALLPSLALLERLAIDGVIVQDLGLAARIHRQFPGIPLHASTQLACTSLAGAQALKALGFVRIVTARELTLEEAAEIGEKAGVEIEVFVHGALCYSISGLCLFSSLTTGRSGNRGRCAYCCRQAFREYNPESDEVLSAHPFSMRDLALIDSGDALRRLPLASLKIEGRMKNPLYVAAVTDLYRHLLDGRLTPALRAEKTENLRTIFSRPWTTLYADSLKTPVDAIIDPLCVGHRGAPIGRVLRVLRDTDGITWLTFDTARPIEKHDGLQIDPPEGGRPIGFAVLKLRDNRTRKTALTLPAGTRVDVALPPDVREIPRGAVVYCSASQAVRRAFPVAKPRSTDLRMLKPADLMLTLAPDALTLSGNGVSVSTPATLTPAKDPSRTSEAAHKLLSRLGDDGFFLRTLTLDDGGLFLPAGLLNATRRAWADRARNLAETAVKSVTATGWDAAQTPRTPVTKAVYTLKVVVEQTPSVLGDEMPESVVVALTPTTTLATVKPWLDAVPYERLTFALPVALRRHDMDALAGTIAALIDKGFRKFECADLTSWQCLQAWSPYCDALELSADWTWYAINPDAEARLQACGITRCVTGPEENLPNLTALPGILPREVLIMQYAPLFIAYTRPHTKGEILFNREGKRLRMVQVGALWITFDERPWSAENHLRELMQAGFGHFRIDLSWAGRALPVETWQEARNAPEVLAAHFTEHRL
ncbi:MAG: U32 family peptidase [Kiritimatiellae bacterium]|nr:U32 family peptidase [Kiritimatiellia bacterium]